MAHTIYKLSEDALIWDLLASRGYHMDNLPPTASTMKGLRIWDEMAVELAAKTRKARSATALARHFQVLLKIRKEAIEWGKTMMEKASP